MVLAMAHTINETAKATVAIFDFLFDVNVEDQSNKEDGAMTPK